MRILYVTSEAYPLAKTGGLADVSEALPQALSRLGADVRIILPGYPSALDRLTDKRTEATFANVMGIGDIRLIGGRMPTTRLPVWLVDAPSLYDRDGGPYQDSFGGDWADNAQRFGLLNHVAARVAMGVAVDGWSADVVHANDWHAGLLPLLLMSHGDAAPATLFTIHNMAFQGIFPMEALGELHLPDVQRYIWGLEHYGQIYFLKAGIRYADRLTTVSPTYADQILTPEYGHGLDGVLRERQRDLVGILNGVDYGIWNPSMDMDIAATYGSGDVSGKRACKLALLKELGLTPDPDVLLLAFVSRLTTQKMADILLESMHWLVGQDMQIVIHGEGERQFEDALSGWCASHRDKIAVRIGYDEALAHRVLAASDVLLAPSRFEPCGLTQMYAMKYGAVPVARRTGGLADTVVDADRRAIAAGRATGFVFVPPTCEAMTECIGRAIAIYREPLLWRRIQRRAMRKDFGWTASARKYLDLYREILSCRGPPDAFEQVDVAEKGFVGRAAGDA